MTRGARPAAGRVPELALLLEGCRAGVSQRRHPPARRADAVTAIDWETLVALMLRHDVAPLFRLGVSRLDFACLPDDIAAALDDFAGRTAAENEASERALVEIVRALHQCSIPAIPFKGPALARLLYGDVALRVFSDLDVIVQPRDAPAALRVLEDLGYGPRPDERRLTPRGRAAVYRYQGQARLLHRETQRVVEPHWALAPSVAAVDLDYAALWQRAGAATYGGVPVGTLSAEDHFIALCIHGAKEQWWRLKHLTDLARFIVVSDAVEWPRVVALARDQGCLRMVLVGVAAANRLLDAPVPEALRGLLTRDGVAQSLVAWVCRNTANPAFDRDTGLSRFRLRSRERFRDRVSSALRTVLTPRKAHFLMLPLPDALFAAYFPVKLVHDYLLHPLWMGHKRMRRLWVGLAPAARQ